MRFRAPVARVNRGQAITAGLWNALADAVNGPRLAPRDLDGGLESVAGAPYASQRQLVKLSETTEQVRVEDPSDASVFLEFDRVVRMTLVDRSSGTVEEWEL